jgi:hypothetical protein
MGNIREELGGNIIRRLSNGLEVRQESVDENDNEVTFEFVFINPITLSSLSELYTPGSGNDVIYQKLIQKGWILPDGTIFYHFKMDILEDKKNNKIKFRYYLANPTETRMVN